MKKQSIIIWIVFCVLSNWVQGQDNERTKNMYIPVHNERGGVHQTKHEFKISSTHILIKTKQVISRSEISRILNNNKVLVKSDNITDLGNGKSFICPLPLGNSINIVGLTKAIAHDTIVQYTNYFIYDSDPTKISAPLNELFFQFNEDIDKSFARDLLRNFGGELVLKKANGVEKYTISKEYDPMDVCTELFETGFFKFCEPNKLNLSEMSDADYTDDQWYINSIDASADTRIDDAWSIPGAKQGDDVVIAVIDLGVQAHTDLSGQLVLGYDAVPAAELSPADGGPGSITENRNNAHGTNVAGIIVAKQQTIGFGITGVAYNAKVMSIRSGYNIAILSGGVWGTSVIWQDEWTVDAYDHARTNGADIINCSFGKNSLFATGIENLAIEEAIIHGRGGLGIPVMCSSGNYEAGEFSGVDFPADHPLTISVGATKKDDSRAVFSSYGSEMDLSAPGVSISTLDIFGYDPVFDWDADGVFDEDQGKNGLGTFEPGAGDYSELNYTNNFSGTSASCPIAAGVMALILSNGPSLTQAEAREILENSCDKPTAYTFTTDLAHPNGTWNIELGHGRVNALKAVTTTMELFAPTDLGGASETFVNIDYATLYDNVCYDMSSPAFIEWQASANYAFPADFGFKYLSNGLIEIPTPDPNLHTQIYGLEYGTYVFGDPGNYSGTNTADILFDVEPTYPYTHTMRLDIGAPAPITGGIQTASLEFDLNIRGINLSVSETEVAICDGDLHSITAEIGGAAPPYNYSFQRKVGGSWINLFPPEFSMVPVTRVYTISSLYYDDGNNEFRVRVLNSDGCSRKSDIIDVFVSDISITNDDFDACLNDISIPLNIAPIGGYGSYSAVWSPAVFLSDPTLVNPMFNPAGAVSTDYMVTIADETGCTTTESVHVEVNVVDPYLSITANADPDIVCRGGDSELSGSAASGVGPPFIFIWSDDSGTELDVSTSLTSYDVENLDETTTYTYTIIDKYNCTADANVTITVDPTLGPTIGPFTPIEICPGAEVVLDPTIYLPLGGGVLDDIAYTWSTGSTGSSITVSDLETTDYSLHVIDENGCYDEKTVTVLRNAAIGPLISLDWENEGLVCPGEIAEISSSVTGGTPAYSYAWSTGETTADILLNSDDFTTVSLTVLDQNDCVATEEIHVSLDPIIITMDHPDGDPNPRLDFSYKPEPCFGDVIDLGSKFSELGGLIEGGSGTYTTEFYVVYSYRNVGDPTIYTYELPMTTDFPVISIVDDPIEIGLPDNIVIVFCSIRIRVTDEFGCKYENEDGTPKSFVSMLWPLDNIVPEFVFEESACPTSSGEIYLTLRFSDIYHSAGWGKYIGSANINVTSVWPLPIYTYSDYTSRYTWSHKVITLPSAGEYLITVTFTTSCGTETFTRSITVGDNAIGVTADNEIVCDLDANVSNYGKYTVATNSSCAVDVTTSNHVRYIAGKTVMLQSGFHSHNQSDFIAKIDKCLLNKSMSFEEDEPDETATWKVYPNPNVGLFKIEMDRSELDADLLVYDVLGSIIEKQSLTESVSEIDLRGLPKGVYFVSLKRGNLSKVEKVIIQ